MGEKPPWSGSEDPHQQERHGLPMLRTDAGNIRITADKKYSVFDWLAAEGYKNPRDIWQRLQVQYPEDFKSIVAFCDNTSFGGEGGAAKKTPVIAAEGAEHLAMLLPGGKSPQWRVFLLRTMRAVAAGDERLLHIMVENQQNDEALKRVEARLKAKTTNRLLTGVLKEHGAQVKGATGNTYAMVNGANNQAVYGRKATEIQEAFQVTQTRDGLLKHPKGADYLNLMVTTEMLEVANLQKTRAFGQHAILDAVTPVCDDILKLRRKYGIPDVPLPQISAPKAESDIP